MTQLQLAFDFSAPPEPVLLGIDPESIEALIEESSVPVKIPEIRAQDLEPELQPAAHKPKCQFLVLPEREAPKGVSRDYRITDADEVGQGNLKTKFQNNLAAIRLLKQLQEQQRTGISPEEKRILVRYCGWGALAQKAFKYDYEFYDLQRELRELLSEDEYDQASASTVNAHYTSPLVITALWRAATRLGIQAQSRILEPAAGIGHFLGLQPDQIKSNSRVSSSTILLTSNMRRKRTAVEKPRGPEKRATCRWLRHFCKQLCPTRVSYFADGWLNTTTL
jgi:hypothetical protein